jgi:hypothetical protein
VRVYVCMCVCARVRPRARARVCVHKRAYTDKLHIQRWRPNGWTDRDPHWYKHSLGQSAQVMGVGERVARAIGAAQPSPASAKRENERKAREYMNETWRHNRREREARVCGSRIAQGASRLAWSKNTIAESQIDSSR